MKKTISIALVVLAALAMFGVGYAWWSETLTVGGTVNTGTVNVGWGAPGNPTDDEPAGINATWTEATRSTDRNTLTLTVRNTYPSITHQVPISVINEGTVPVRTGTISFTGVPAGVTMSSTGLAHTGLAANGSTPGTITIHIAPTVSQNTTFTITGTLGAIQWNAP